MIIVKVRIFGQPFLISFYIFSYFPSHPFHDREEINVLYFKLDSEKRCSFQFPYKLGRIEQEFLKECTLW